MSKKQPTINEQIKKERLRQGLTRYRVSQLMGVSQSHYDNLEKTTKSPSLAMISKVCIALEIDIIITKSGETKISNNE